MSWLHRVVEKYYQFRKYTRPTAMQALFFLISEIGELVEAFAYERCIPDMAEQDFLRCVVEQGEIADAMVSNQDKWVRNGDRQGKPVVADEIADVLMMLVVFASCFSIDVVQALLAKMRKKGFEPDDLGGTGTNTHTSELVQ